MNELIKDKTKLFFFLLTLEKVEQIITSEEEMANIGEHKGAKHAPAVVFHDQNGKKVAHKPGTLNDLDKEE